MKTFKDLEFFWDFNIDRARLNFKNDYGISVITGKYACSDSEHPYECAVLYKGDITYITHITNDVIGYCNEKMVTDIMKEIQEL